MWCALHGSSLHTPGIAWESLSFCEVPHRPKAAPAPSRDLTETGLSETVVSGSASHDGQRPAPHDRPDIGAQPTESFVNADQPPKLWTVPVGVLVQGCNVAAKIRLPSEP